MSEDDSQARRAIWHRGRSPTTSISSGPGVEHVPGEISLRVRVEQSQVRQRVIILGGAVSDTRTYTTNFTAKDGQILVLGDIIKRDEIKVERKAPILGDIPILGWYLFRKTDTQMVDTELMVFLYLIYF